MHDEDRQTLLEVYSGHGNSEQWSAFEELTLDDAGHPTCPAPRANYLPTCWQAGEIIRGRCLADGESSETCEERAVAARPMPPHRTAPAGSGYAPARCCTRHTR